MRVAFVSANRENMPDAVIPLGLLYVMAACPERHEKVLLDLCYEEEPLAFLEGRLAGFRPDLVAVGLRNIQNADYTGTATNLSFYRELLRSVRRVTAAPIAVGGGGFSVMPAELMEALRPDYGISGEGERALPQLLDALERGEPDLDAIDSLYRFVDDRVVHSPRRAPFLVLDDLAVPDRSLVDPRYYEDAAIDSVQTKRGCPLKCEYCTYPRIEGARGRLRDPARVAREFAMVREAHPGVRHVFIVDSVFNLPVRHAKDVCRALLEHENELPWTCYANPIGFDAELADLMRRARCVGMEIGSDSGCNEVLARLRKGFTVDEIRRIRDLSREAGLKDCHSFILGTEGESLDDVRRTLDFIADLEPYAAILLVWVDDREAVDEDYARRRRRLREEIHAVVRERAADQRRWVIPPLGIHFSERQFRLLRRAGCEGPLWQHLELAAG
jgi:radical SAM superfamily enzyme YgiQ (UPF0313 family)